MSISKFNVILVTEKPYAYFITISLFGSDNMLISPISNSGHQLNFKLEKGLYTLRVELNGEINDTIISVDMDKKIMVTDHQHENKFNTVVNLPPQFSSALLNSKTYYSSHEYYTNPSIEISTRNTFVISKKSVKQKNSSLFLFLRFPSLQKYQEYKKENGSLFYENFQLVNENGEVIIDFNSGKGIELDENFGWVAFNAQLPHGMYYLIYLGENSRQIPIYVFKNWHTQFFMTLQNKPLFGSIRVFISKKRVFEPDKQSNKYIDILLDKLQNNDYSVDEELLNTVAQGKYDSPMLGIICLYIYFKGNPSIKNNVFYTILENLRNNILKGNNDSPDIKALDILSFLHSNKIPVPFEKTIIKGTPMLRAGFEAIVHASLADENLIQQNSINDFVAESICYDSPFTTFKPIPFTQDEENFIFDDNNNNELFPDSGDFSESTKDNIDPKRKISFDHFKDSVCSGHFLHENSIESENSWIRNSISEMLTKNKDLTISDLSRQLFLPKNTIARVLSERGKDL